MAKKTRAQRHRPDSMTQEIHIRVSPETKRLWAEEADRQGEVLARWATAQLRAKAKAKNGSGS